MNGNTMLKATYMECLSVEFNRNPSLIACPYVIDSHLALFVTFLQILEVSISSITLFFTFRNLFFSCQTTSCIPVPSRIHSGE